MAQTVAAQGKAVPEAPTPEAEEEEIGCAECAVLEAGRVAIEAGPVCTEVSSTGGSPDGAEGRMLEKFLRRRSWLVQLAVSTILWTILCIRHIELAVTAGSLFLRT